MKKLLLALMSILMALTLVACGSKEEDSVVETPKEPVRYSDVFYLLTADKSVTTIEDLEGKRIGYASTIDKELNSYVIEEIKNQVNIDERLFIDFAEYQSLPDNLNNFDAFILPKDIHESILNDYRSDYVPKDYSVIAEFQKPYYEEEVIDSKILKDDLFNKPFAVMITGLDGAADADAYQFLRNDVNHLMIVDPTLKHITMISFPRDSYVYNNVKGYKDKLTHHGLNGTENVKRSIETLLDVEIPYFCQVSFSTFVDLVNALGGVWVDVPLDTYMDMDSNRNVAQPYEMSKGYKKLYGEWALALARNRKYKNIYNADCGRLRNQALIITSMIKRIAEHPRVLDMAGMSWLAPYLAYYNFTDDQVKTLFALAKEFGEGYTVDNYFMEGEGGMAGDMYVYHLYDDSIEIAKGKYELAMTHKIDEDNKFYDEIMTGWINRGTGTYNEGYLGEEYDLHEIFGLKKPTVNVENVETTNTTIETVSE